jgi:hypothetical protein
VTSPAIYPIYYYPNTVTISGTFTGRGIIFADSSITIAGNISVAANSTLVLITPNLVTVSASVTQIHAYLYSASELTTSGPLAMTGALVANNLSLGGSTSVVYDPYISLTAGEAHRLCVPGLWP